MKLLKALGLLLLSFILMDIELLIYGYAASYVWASLLAPKLPFLQALDWKFFAGALLLMLIFNKDVDTDKSWEDVLSLTFARIVIVGMVCALVAMIK